MFATRTKTENHCNNYDYVFLEYVKPKPHYFITWEAKRMDMVCRVFKEWRCSLCYCTICIKEADSW